MKFAHQLKALEGSAAQEWRGKFIHYKDLKKAIKLCKYVRVLRHIPSTWSGFSSHAPGLPSKMQSDIGGSGADVWHQAVVCPRTAVAAPQSALQELPALVTARCTCAPAGQHDHTQAREQFVTLRLRESSRPAVLLFPRALRARALPW